MLRKNQITSNSAISVRTLVVIGFLLSFAICVLYAHSAAAAYGALELAIAVVCYIGCLKRYKMVDGNSLIYGVFVSVLAWCAGVFQADFKSTLFITVPLLMPLYISTLNITYKGWSDFVPVTIIALTVTCLTVESPTFAFVNSNTLGFLGFMGISFGVLWIKNAKKKLFPTAIVLFGFYYAIQSGSRNVAIVGLICVALLFLPNAILKKRITYFVICLTVILYSIFAADIMEWIFSKPKLYQFLVNYTGNYSEKAWEMANRIEFLRGVQDRVSRRGILFQLFGTGTLTTHGHNMFYQCILNFGYIGTALIYAGFCRLFKVAYVLISKKHDDLALGCVIILWGTFLLQGADVFMIGPESYAVVPQVIMGIVLNRYGVYCRECEKKPDRHPEERTVGSLKAQRNLSVIKVSGSKFLKEDA